MNSSELPTLSQRDIDEVQRAAASGRPVIVFVHGLWQLADSWDHWRARFEARGYATIAPAWPTDAATVEQARAATQRSRVSVDAVTAHYAGVLRSLNSKPILIGHSLGGLVVQQLAGRRLASSTVAISPAPSRGIYRLPASVVRASWPVLRNPANRGRAVSLTFEQFRSAFANAIDLDEARRLYDSYAVPGAGLPLLQAAFANLNPRSALRVDVTNRERGPMKIISAELDRIVPWSVACAAFKRQQRNPGHTEYFEMLDRGHSLVIDSGWEDVADVALRFIHRMYERQQSEGATVPAMGCDRCRS